MLCGSARRHLPEACRMESARPCFQAIPVALCLLLGIGAAAPGPGSDPVLHMAGHKDSGVWVLCLSAGWYPEPHVLWRNGRGETLSPESEQKPLSDDGLFNVSSSLVVLESSDPALTCTIRAVFSGPERETTIRITGLFPRHAPEMTAFLIFLPVSLFLVPLAVYLFRKLRVLKEETSKEREWRQFLDKVSLSAAEVTLDQSTANPFLVLSVDGRSVTCGILWQDVPKSDRRFDPLPCVLASQCFAAGQRYWDVEVGQGGDWAMGAARRDWAMVAARVSMEHIRAFRLSPDVGVWALQCQEGEWSALTCPETLLQLESAPRIVRVHLDCERGSLAFYNAGNMSHIFTFTGCSREPLFPFFLLWSSGTQLTILPPGQRKAMEMGRTTCTVTPTLGERQDSLIELLIMPGQS
ncbi:butyrophilin subfamily 1 member A1-like isoform X4 [Mauremys reevesii]|nr:butyrophilin subfamily 1 member A1-like isoform X4 [Mauremys reevesii]